MNIVLIGYRCSGKSSVGKLLALELEKDFLDTDQLIETYSNRTIEEIVEKDGWEYFRNIERKVIGEVSGKKNAVIATGGGAVMDEGNLRNLKRNSFLIWLKIDSDMIRMRMSNDQRTGSIRPSLTGNDPEDEIKRVLEQREPFYRQAGNMEVETDRMSLEEVANEIIKKLPMKVIG